MHLICMCDRLLAPNFKCERGLTVGVYPRGYVEKDLCKVGYERVSSLMRQLTNRSSSPRHVQC